MTQLALTRSPEDRRLYVLGDIGSLRFEGFFSRSATAEAGGRSWAFARRSVFTARAEAADSVGTLVGEFEPKTLGRGGTIRWRNQSLALRPASTWRERYALADARPLDPALLLFAVFVVRGLADDASGTAGAAASTAATAG